MRNHFAAVKRTIIRHLLGASLGLLSLGSSSCSENFQDVPLPELKSLADASDSSLVDSSIDSATDNAIDTSISDTIAEKGDANADADASADADLIPVGVGKNCSVNAGCTSGVCADGVCCETLCQGCSSCNQPGFLGTCKPVADGSDSHGTCSGNAVACKGVCDGQGQCRWPSANLSCGPSSCDPTGIRVVQPSCNKNGDCVSQSKSCGAYRCNSATLSCFASCDTAGPQCTADGSCVGGSCDVKRALGAPCATNNNCVKGICEDGVCCDRACGGTCEACDISGHIGTCTAIASGTDPQDECPGKILPCAGVCDGASGCKYLAIGELCGNTTCTTSPAQTHDFVCDGEGQCVETLKNCGPYLCESTGQTCATQCSAQLGCSPGYLCEAGQCTTK